VKIRKNRKACYGKIIKEDDLEFKITVENNDKVKNKISTGNKL